MPQNKETEQRKEFRDILFALSDSKINDEGIGKLKGRFKKLYETSFRHFYSDIFSILRECHDGAESIISNLDVIRSSIDSDDEDLSKQITKVYDHTCLEYSRIKSEERLIKNETEIQKLESQTKQRLRSLNKQSKALQGKTFNIQKDFVAILGIFAGIVMVFSGRLSFRMRH